MRQRFRNKKAGSIIKTRDFYRLGTLIIGLLVAGLALGCGEETNLGQPKLSTRPPSTPAPAQPGQNPARSGPLVGADGQITVVAPAPSGETLPGVFFWVKENNIWQGGSATTGGKALSAKDLGGKQLTKAAALALAKSPALSPDGLRLAYAYSPEPEGTAGNIVIGQDIYVVDLKTGANSLLVKRDEPQTFLDNPGWSADGKQLYFDARTPRRDKTNTIVGENITINRLDLATNQREKLAEDAREPFPTADGKQVVYVYVDASNGTYQTSLKILDLKTKQAKTLLTPEQGFVGVYQPHPAPDGQFIVFSGAGGPNNNFNLPPTPVGSQAEITGKGVGLNSPLLHGTPFDLWVIKPDGSGLKQLTMLYEDQPLPVWSKDSKQISFLAGQGLYTIDADGKNLNKKSDMGGHGGFDWRSN